MERDYQIKHKNSPPPSFYMVWNLTSLSWWADPGWDSGGHHTFFTIVGYGYLNFSTTLTLKISKPEINQLLNTLCEWALPWARQFAGHEQFLNKLPQVTRCHCCRRTEKTHLKQRGEFKWQTPPGCAQPGSPSLGARQWGPPQPREPSRRWPSRPRSPGVPSPHLPGLVLQQEAEDVRAAVQRGGSGSELGSTAGRLADFSSVRERDLTEDERERGRVTVKVRRPHYCLHLLLANALLLFVSPWQSFSSASACSSPLCGAQGRGLALGVSDTV